MTMPSDVDGDNGEGEEVSRRPMYRIHSKNYKARIVAAYEALPAHSGDRGSLLRREDLRRNQISAWRRELGRGSEDAATLKPSREPKRSADQVEMDRLRLANERLRSELDRTKLALEITGKTHALLELFSESAAYDDRL